MVWLSMVTFAGVGGLTAGQLATMHHWPILLGILFGGLVATPMGIVMGLLTIRLGNLYVALVTLTFGLLMDNLVFTNNTFVQGGVGVVLDLPSFAHTAKAYSYFALVVFILISLFVVNLRRSTTGMALTAVRSSEAAARTIGIGIVQTKVVLAALATFVAGVGGAMLAVSLQVALPTNYATLIGVVWLAVLVTQGIRTNVAALTAGLSFTLLPGLALAYLPTSFGQVPPILFGLGAVFIAKNPDGSFATLARQLRWVVLRFHRSPSEMPVEVGDDAERSGTPIGVDR
jgi:branched-chain amino acid transport system permease protein